MSKQKYKEYLMNVIPAIFYGIICGILTGGLIFLFKFLAGKVETVSRYCYAMANERPLLILAIFSVLILLAILMAILHKKIPETKGGGIPRSEGILRGLLTFRWLPTLIGTFFGSMMSFLVGVPVGTEGPAVLLGTSVGGFTGVISKRQLAWRRYVMTGGAGAGFAVATGAPVSGILFALEEVHKRFTPMLILTVAVTVISACGVNVLLCRVSGVSQSLFTIGTLAKFKLSHVGYLAIVGIIVALAVALFDFLTKLFSKKIVKSKGKHVNFIKILIIFTIVGLLALYMPDAVYSGHHLIDELLASNKTLLMLIILLAIRFVLMLLVTDGNVTGGIFIPMLAIGALAGALISKLLVVMGLPQQYSSAIILLSMCAFIGGILRAPLTATILFIELSGQFDNLLYVAFVIFIVSVITEILNQKPLYDRKLESMHEEHVAGKTAIIKHFKMQVSNGAFVIGKAVRDVMWPTSSVVIGVIRQDEKNNDTDNDGEKKLYAGDTLIIRAKYYDKDELISLLQSLVGNDYPIEDYKMKEN